jgi:two-component sensor histidine kinase
MPYRSIGNSERGPGKVLDRRTKQSPNLPQERLSQTQALLRYRRDGVERRHRPFMSRDGCYSVDLSKFLREIGTSALSAGEQTELVFDLKADCEISATRAEAVALVVREAVTNALKHAHPAGVPGNICVASAHDKDRGLVVEVADDGVGLPEGFDPLTVDSTGIRLMRRCADDVSGRLEFGRPPIGLCVRLEMPLSHERT